MKHALLAATMLGFAAMPAYALPSIDAGSTLNVVGNATFNGVDVTFAASANLVTGTGACPNSAAAAGGGPRRWPRSPTCPTCSSPHNGDVATVNLTSQVDPPTIVGSDLSLNDDALRR